MNSDPEGNWSAVERVCRRRVVEPPITVMIYFISKEELK
jgi:hypothetical protein